jgi:hypothetical protein
MSEDTIEYFRAMRDAARDERAKALDDADTKGWTQHTPYHFSRIVDGQKIDWWPGVQKARWRKKMFYGEEQVAALFKSVLGEFKPCYVCGNPMDGKSEDDCHCFHRMERSA